MRAGRPWRIGGVAAQRGATCGLWALATCCLLGGCSTASYFQADQYATAKLAAPYRRVQLKGSSTLDVLSLFDSPGVRMDADAVGGQSLTQSDTAVALSAQSTDGLKMWVNLVAFDEYRMTARRKYFFCSDEQAVAAPDDPKQVLIPPRKGLLFDAQVVLDPEITTTPYATDQARRIAVVRWLSERFKGDVRDLAGRATAATGADERTSTAGVMMNQVFQGILVKLDQSSALARNLGDAQGVEFPHISLDKGRIRMVVVDDVATVTIRVNLPMAPPPRL